MDVLVKAVFMKSNVTWQLAYILRFANAIREYLFFFLPEVRSLPADNLLAGKHRAVPPITVVLIDFFNVFFPVEEIR